VCVCVLIVAVVINNKRVEWKGDIQVT